MSTPYNLFIPNKNTQEQPSYGTDMRIIEIAHNNLATGTAGSIAFLNAAVATLASQIATLQDQCAIDEVTSWLVGSAPPVNTRLTAFYGYTNCALNVSGEGFITLPGGGYSHGYVGFVQLAGVYQPTDLPNVLLNLWHDNSSLADLWFTTSYINPQITLNIPATPYFGTQPTSYPYGQQPGAAPSPSVNVTFMTIGA